MKLVVLDEAKHCIQCIYHVMAFVKHCSVSDVYDLTGVPCKHRQKHSRREPAAHSDKGPLSPSPPSDVERMVRH